MVTSNNTVALPKLLRELSRLFVMKDLGPLHYFLGIEVHRIHSNLYFTHTKYVLNLLHKTNMKDAKPIKSQIQIRLKLSQYEDEPISNAT